MNGEICIYCNGQHGTVVPDFAFKSDCWACAERRRVDVRGGIYVSDHVEDGELYHRVNYATPIMCRWCGKASNHVMARCLKKRETGGELAGELFKNIPAEVNNGKDDK